MTKKKAVFLDRDGVVNRQLPEGRYVASWEELEILSGVPEAIGLLNQAGYLVFIATNQRGVAKGLMSLDDLDQIHRRLTAELASRGAAIVQIYSCPHDDLPPCRCRKPAPGMLLDAVAAHHLDLASSWMIGDSPRDIQAGQNAGCRTIRITYPPELVENLSASNLPVPSVVVPEPVADLSAVSLLDAVHQILSRQK
jgi:D-glycero-D-manno-heptose 1,7-bisphosphate phosphatase